MQKNNYMDIMEKNHMEIPWHDYTENDSNVLIGCHLHRGCRTYVHRI